MIPSQLGLEIERLLRRDPARRGVARQVHEQGALTSGQLEAAARSLAEQGRSVGMVTGFCVASTEGYVAETDGPPGALYLARALLSLGVEVAIITDHYATPLLEAGCDLWDMPRGILHQAPFEPGGPDAPSRESNETEHNRETDAWIDGFLASSAGRGLTHLIAIERAGPSHTEASIVAQHAADQHATDRQSTSQHATDETGSADVLAEFVDSVPAESRNVCHNMRGESINAHTAKLHRLFEIVAQRDLPITTIGIADGGNEIGAGRIPWRVLRRAIAFGPAGRIACRIATDHLLVAGVSNWGGYALASMLCRLRDRGDVLQTCGTQSLRELIETLVRETSCVDGVTRRREATVDGLPLETYLQTLHGIRRLCGWED